MFTKLQSINVAQFRELVLYDDAVRTLYGKNFFEELQRNNTLNYTRESILLPFRTLMSKRSLSLVAYRRLCLSKLLPNPRILQHRFISNGSDDSLPTRYTLPDASSFTDKSSLPSTTSTNIIKRQKCMTCGIGLQFTDKDKVGFCKVPEFKSWNLQTRSKDVEYYKAYSKLDDEGKKILEEGMEKLNSNLTKERILNEKKERGVKITEEGIPLSCVRCYDAVHHSKFDLPENRISNYERVMDSIPENAALVHVSSAYDFPLGLMKVKKGNRAIHVVNKADLLFSNFKAPNRYGIQYFADVVERLTGSRSTHLVCSNNQWNIADLLDALPRLSYLVGYVNTGKTLLANKLRNRALSNVNDQHKWEPAQGSSFLPGLTRGNIEVDLVGKRTFDTPGVLPAKTTYDAIKPDYVKSAMTGVPLYSVRIKEARYRSVHGGQCYTAGGIAYVIPPEGTLLQIVSVTKGNPHAFRDLEKAKEVIAKQPKSFQGICVKPETTKNLVRYVIPPFYGKIDLVIKDYGYFQITPIGRYDDTCDLFEVWAPEGVVVGVRQAIASFVTKSVPLDKKGKKMKKWAKNRAQRVITRDLPTNEKLFTRLYRVPVDCEDTWAEMKLQYEKHLDEEGSTWFNGNKCKGIESQKTKYWIEKIYD